MNTSGSEIKIFAGNSNKKLASDIARNLGVELGNCEVSKFSDGEIGYLYNTIYFRACRY